MIVVCIFTRFLRTMIVVYMYTRFFRTMIAVIYSHARISQARLPLYIDTSDRFG